MEYYNSNGIMSIGNLLMLADILMVALQGLGPAVSLPESRNALHCGHGCRDGGNIRDLTFRIVDTVSVISFFIPSDVLSAQRLCPREMQRLWSRIFAGIDVDVILHLL